MHSSDLDLGHAYGNKKEGVADIVIVHLCHFLGHFIMTAELSLCLLLVAATHTGILVRDTDYFV